MTQVVVKVGPNCLLFSYEIFVSERASWNLTGQASDVYCLLIYCPAERVLTLFEQIKRRLMGALNSSNEVFTVLGKIWSKKNQSSWALWLSVNLLARKVKNYILRVWIITFGQLLTVFIILWKKIFLQKIKFNYADSRMGE